MASPRPSKKRTRNEVTLAEAISHGFGILSELAEEVREVVDNSPVQSPRIETLGEAADYLENHTDEPELPEGIDDSFGCTYITDESRSLSRSRRRDNAVAALSAVVGVLEDTRDGLEGDDVSEREAELQEVIDACQSAIDDAESCEFPGMMG